MDSQPVDSDYRVEVSGWDVSGSFFVERVILELSQDGERIVHLKHRLRSGLIVFLRLMESRVCFPALPVAYQVIEVGVPASDGTNRVNLRKLQHRRTTNPPAAETTELP